ncbi:MAG: undecaprenyldiphospho-muramoylpentapeptide beta-N-acetylglucosaminyltransferase [Firmicutes bacterium]|nr:undecaprenyldiphospho-muramoylpentapeptide beta-N-acetylglucosaminyltransferase [Bacillota bacterium]MCM1401077.1 undecaprenyldiphospho-muramoylpentapeptide beta-N-acetylglucosaminyltransferase [Bacteroides sp.]MCM1476996.1 undecaprenyldiphospho-muramoylpentapeptide beta-N-acetylglucosaminyltransferase [Bacteroides sp.]
MKSTEKNNKRPLRVLISGGGTGGHIFPAVSIANALRRRNPDTEILFVGALGRMEMERVPAAGYEIIGLPVAGFDRKRLWRNIQVVAKLLRSMAKAGKVLKNFNPDIAVGVGGYASGPMLKAAQKRGIPTLLQEQNSYAGVTNKLLAQKAGKICVAYEGMDRFFPAESIVMTGNPVRADIVSCTMSQREARLKLGMDPDMPMVLVVGGSLGARTVNESIARYLPEITATGAQVLWQTGKAYAGECAEIAEKYPHVKATAFISDMAAAYRAANLLVSRAGASTISEIQLLGIPSVLVPSPNVAEDHQRKNAQALASRHAAVMVLDADAPQQLGKVVTELMANPAELKTIGENAAAMALRNSDEKIVDCIYELLNK